MPLSRREVLLLSAAAAVIAIPAALRSSLPPPKASFGEDDLAVVEALARMFYGPGAEALGVSAALKSSLGFLDESQQTVLASLPSTFDLLSRVLVPTCGAFVSLGEAAQVAAVEDWISSPLAFRRHIIQALRQLVLSHCYTNPAVHESIGYPGPWIGRVDLPIHALRFGEPE